MTTLNFNDFQWWRDQEVTASKHLKVLGNVSSNNKFIEPRFPFTMRFACSSECIKFELRQASETDVKTLWGFVKWNALFKYLQTFHFQPRHSGFWRVALSVYFVCRSRLEICSRSKCLIPRVVDLMWSWLLYIVMISGWEQVLNCLFVDKIVQTVWNFKSSSEKI